MQLKEIWTPNPKANDAKPVCQRPKCQRKARVQGS
jgi:hypothetical protein